MADHGRAARLAVGHPELAFEPDAVLAGEGHRFHGLARCAAVDAERQTAVDGRGAARPDGRGRSSPGLARLAEALGYGRVVPARDRGARRPRRADRRSRARPRRCASERAWCRCRRGRSRSRRWRPRPCTSAPAGARSSASERAPPAPGRSSALRDARDGAPRPGCGASGARGAPDLALARRRSRSGSPRSGRRRCGWRARSPTACCSTGAPPSASRSARRGGRGRRRRRPAATPAAVDGRRLRAGLPRPRGRGGARRRWAATGEYGSYPAYARQFAGDGPRRPRGRGRGRAPRGPPDDVPEPLVRAVTLLGDAATARRPARRLPGGRGRPARRLPRGPSGRTATLGRRHHRRPWRPAALHEPG